MNEEYSETCEPKYSETCREIVTKERLKEINDDFPI